MSSGDIRTEPAARGAFSPVVWRYVVGFLLSALFIFLAFRKVDLHSLGSALKTEERWYLVPAVVLIMLSIWVRAVRWRYILKPVKLVPIGKLFPVTMIGFMANNLLPARLGEIVRAALIGERETISRSASLATIVIERIFDSLTILLMLAVVLLTGSFALPPWLMTAAGALLAGCAAAIALLALFRFKPALSIKLSSALARPLPQRIRDIISRVTRAFIEGLGIFHNPRDIAFSLVLSVFVWIPNALCIHLLLRSFGVELPLSIAFLLLVALCIGVALPSAPGFIGPIQFVSVTMLALFRVPKDLALGFSIVYNAVVFIPITAAGLCYLAAGGVGLGDLMNLTSGRAKR